MVLTASRAAAARGRRELCSVSVKMFSGQLRPSAPWTRTRSSPFLLCLNAGSRESMVAHTYEHFKREFMLASPAEAQRIDLWEEESMKYELEHVEAKQSLLHGTHTTQPRAHAHARRVTLPIAHARTRARRHINPPCNALQPDCVRSAVHLRAHRLLSSHPHERSHTQIRAHAHADLHAHARARAHTHKH